mmetsp:Transcript_40670/g.69404  ORF Transcript_40670/g.69404 Transcript_40670/m.69404 type:complete len:205 (+) Transcript_40670:570-1184(+)
MATSLLNRWTTCAVWPLCAIPTVAWSASTATIDSAATNRSPPSSNDGRSSCSPTSPRERRRIGTLPVTSSPCSNSPTTTASNWSNPSSSRRSSSISKPRRGPTLCSRRTLPSRTSPTSFATLSWECLTPTNAPRPKNGTIITTNRRWTSPTKCTRPTSKYSATTRPSRNVPTSHPPKSAAIDDRPSASPNSTPSAAIPPWDPTA